MGLVGSRVGDRSAWNSFPGCMDACLSQMYLEGRQSSSSWGGASWQASRDVLWPRRDVFRVKMGFFHQAVPSETPVALRFAWPAEPAPSAPAPPAPPPQMLRKDRSVPLLMASPASAPVLPCRLPSTQAASPSSCAPGSPGCSGQWEMVLPQTPIVHRPLRPVQHVLVLLLLC